MNPFFLTFTNHGYCDMVRNLAKSMALSGIQHPLHVACLDDESMTELTEVAPNIEPFLFLQKVSTQAERYFSYDYKRIVYKKLQVITHVLALQLPFTHIWFVDSDIVFFKDVSNFPVEGLENLDVVFQVGGVYPAADLSFNLCTGCMLIRNDPALISFFECNVPFPEIMFGTFDGDQDFINAKLKLEPTRIRYSVFPEKKFANGSARMCFHQLKTEEGLCMLHFNFLIAEEKKLWMRYLHCWYEDSIEYQRTPTQVPPQ